MADELRTVLGFDASQAIETVKQLTTALNNYSTAMGAAAEATKQFNRVASGTQTAINNQAKANTALTSSSTQAAQAQSTYSHAVGQTTQHVNRANKSINKLADDTKKSTGGILVSWQSIARIAVLQVLHQGVSAVKSSLDEAVKSSREFVKGLSEVQTISNEYFNDLDALADKAQEFSAITGQPLDAVTKGLYETLSNQVTDAAGAFDFLRTASDFSIAAVTDLGSAVDLLSSVINSYQVNANDAADISGKLFKAIDLGRFTGQEIGETFGRVAVLSAQLGVSLDELLASMTTLTRSGMKYNEAYTLISNVQLKLIKPTEELKKRFAEMGVATAEAGIQAYGFQGLLMEISKGAGETASELAELYGRVRAIRGALGLGSDFAKTYAEDLRQIKEASAETMAKAKALIFETNAKQVELELNKLNIAMVNFGRSATDATKVVFDQFGGAVGTVRTLTLALTLSAITWFGLRHSWIKGTSDLVKGLIAARKQGELLNKTLLLLKSSTLFWAAAAAGAVVAVSWAWNLATKAIIKARDELEKKLVSREAIELINYDIALKGEKEFSKKYLAEAQKMLIERQKLFNAANPGIQFTQDVLLSALESQLSDHVSAVGSLFSGLKSKAASIAGEIRDIAKDSAAIKMEISDWQFDRSVKSLNSVWQTYKQIERSQSLLAQANDAARRGDIESARLIQQRAEDQAKAAVSSADESGNRVLVAKAEEQTVRAMEGKLAINKTQTKQLQDQATLINRQITSTQLLTASLDIAAKKFGDLADELKKATTPIDRERIIGQMKEIAQWIESQRPQIKVFANLANATELQAELAAAMKGFFDPLTGKELPLDRAIEQSIGRLRDAYKETPDVSEQQKALVELDKTINQGTEALERQNAAQLGIKRNVELINADFALFKQGWTEYASVLRHGKETQETVNNTIQTTTAQLAQAVVKAQDLALAGKSETAEFAAAYAEVIRIRDELIKKYPENALGFGAPKKALDGINQIIERLDGISGKQKEITKDAEQADPARALIDRLKGAADPIQEALRLSEEVARRTGQTINDSITAGVTAAAVNTAISGDKQIGVWNAVAAAARAAAAAAASVPSGSAVATTAARGGLIYRAGGGFAPRGTDTIPAMLSPGEFVVNAASSRRFFSQLVAMNSGRQPVYRQSGGPVGDITINVNESGSPKSTAREVATLIRREIQRGTINKF